MLNTDAIQIVVTAVVSIVGALGLPKMWDYFSRNKEIESAERIELKNREDEIEKGRLAEIEGYKSRISRLEMQVIVVTTSVDVLLMIIKDEFENKPSVKETIENIHRTLSQIRAEHEIQNKET